MRKVSRWQLSGIPMLGLAVILVCTVACSSQTPSAATLEPTESWHPPESFSMGKLPSGEFALLQWNNPNQSAVSFELQWRFSDVPYWVHLASTSPGAATHPANGPGHIAPWNHTGYCYRGRAVLGNSASGWSDEFCDYMGAGEPYLPPPWPLAATDVVAEAINEGVRLTWAAVDLRQFGSLDSLVLRRSQPRGSTMSLPQCHMGHSSLLTKTGAVTPATESTRVSRTAERASVEMCARVDAA